MPKGGPSGGLRVSWGSIGPPWPGIFGRQKRRPKRPTTALSAPQFLPAQNQPGRPPGQQIFPPSENQPARPPARAPVTCAPCGLKPRLFLLRNSVVERDPVLDEDKKPQCTEEEMDAYVWDLGSGRKKGEVPLDKDNHG